MSPTTQIGILVSLNDKASGPLRGLGENVKGVSTSLVAWGAATKILGDQMSGLMSAPIKAFADAENAATQLKTVMMDASGAVGPGFAKVNALATELGNKLPGTTADFQAMMTTLKEMGVSDAAILGGLGKAAAYLGVALKMPFGEAARFSAKLGEAAGVAERDMMAFLDTIARTRNVGVAVDEMGYAYGRSSGKLKEMGLQGIEAARALAPLYANWTKAGLSGETVGTGFASILSNVQVYAYGMSKSAKQARQELAAAGIALNFLDSRGKLIGVEHMIGQLEQLKRLAPDKQARVIRDLFGTGQDAQMVSAMLNGGLAGYREMLARMKAQADLDKKVKEQLGTLVNLWDATTGTFTNAMAAFAGAMEPELKAVAVWLGQISERFGEFAKAHPMLMKVVGWGLLFGGVLVSTAGVLAVVVGMGAKLVSALAPLAKLVPPIVRFFMGMRGWVVRVAIALQGPLLTALSVAARAFMVLGRALLLNPIGLAVTAIALAGYLIYKYWDKLKPLPGQALQWGKDLINGLIGGISARIGAVRDRIVGLTSSIKAWFTNPLSINSPSRVFMGFGANIGEGAELGILGRVSRVKGAAAKMAGAAVAGAALAGAAGATGVGQRAGAAGAGTVVHYSPTITVQGGAAADVVPAVQRALKISERDFEQLLDRVLAQRTRRGY